VRASFTYTSSTCTPGAFSATRWDAHHDAALVVAALNMAAVTRGGAVAGVIFHSDSEYTSAEFAQARAPTVSAPVDGPRRVVVRQRRGRGNLLHHQGRVRAPAARATSKLPPKLPVLRLPGLVDRQDARWGLYEAALVGRDDGLYAVAQVEFGEDVTDVRFDCCFAEDEPGGYFGVGQSLADQGEDFAFACGEICQRGGLVVASWVGVPRDQSGGDSGGEE
jgi:hypothetical protein